MTRHEAIIEQEELFGSGLESDLPSICLNLRMATNGSADPWDDAFINVTLRMLQARLDTWEESSTACTKRFDDAVKELVAATIEEVRGKS